jgi:hypothetical protein
VTATRQDTPHIIAVFTSERVGEVGQSPQKGAKSLHPIDKSLFDLKNAILEPRLWFLRGALCQSYREVLIGVLWVGDVVVFSSNQCALCNNGAVSSVLHGGWVGTGNILLDVVNYSGWATESDGVAIATQKLKIKARAMLLSGLGLCFRS